MTKDTVVHSALTSTINVQLHDAAPRKTDWKLTGRSSPFNELAIARLSRGQRPRFNAATRLRRDVIRNDVSYARYRPFSSWASR